MARAKTQMTGFARFLIFLIIAAPVIFFGVSYYKGEDPMQTLRDTFVSESPVRQDAQESTNEVAGPPSEAVVNSELAKLRDELEFKEKRITDLYRENEELKAKLKEQEEEFADIRQQLDQIKSAIQQ